MNKGIILFIFQILAFINLCIAQDGKVLVERYKQEFEKLFDNHTRFDSMGYLLEEIIRISHENNLFEEYIYGLIASTNIAYIQADFESMACYAELSLVEGNAKLFRDHSYFGSIYNNLGTYYASLGDLNNAIKYNLTSLKYIPNYLASSEDYKNFLISLENLGILYGNQGDIEKAVSFYKRVISLSSDSVNQRDNNIYLQSIVSCNYDIAIDYYSQQKYEEARYYYENNLKLFNKHKINDGRFRIWNYISAANTYRCLKLFKECRESLRLARKHQEEYFQEHGVTPREKNFFNVYALYYADVDSFSKAIEFSNKAIEICFKEYPAKNNNSDCGDLTSILGEIYELRGDALNALKFNHLALSYYSQSYKNQDDYLNSIPIELFKNSSQELIKIVTNKINNLKLLFEIEGRDSYLYAAYSHAQLLLQLSDSYREQIQTLNSQLFVSHELRPSFEQAIEISLKLHEITGEQKYLYEAFSLAEKGKAVLLANALNDTYAKYSGGVPDSLLAKERELKANISFYKNQIFKEENKIEGIDSLKIDSWERKVFKFEREHEDFDKMLVKNYPDYHDYLNQEETINVKDIQRNLDPNTCLIEFFAGDSSLYIFFLDKDGLSYKEITSPNEIYKEIDEFSTSFREEDSKPQSISEFKKSAFFLFDEILAEKISSYSKLIFIPDGQLGIIPYEFLLTKKDDTSSFRDLSYLGNTYDIQYGYSAKLLYNAPLKRRRQTSKKLWAGFAPHFEGEKRLVFNSQEVEGINQLMQGDIFINSEANLTEAKAIIDQYKILHFATHGYSQMERPMYSRIEFTFKDSLEDGVFYAHDLMNHKINADLVVLSACETGEGKVAKGEGIMSFAWAFRYAGAPSILMSLWKAESSVSQRIMLSFYSYLKEGKSKTEALRLAKRDYIQNPIAGREHPKYWANFILIGDDTPIFIDPKMKWVSLAGLALFLILVLMAIYQKRKEVF